MADLGAHKDKNAARLAKLKRARTVPIPDAMVGYPKSSEPERKASPFAKKEPAAKADQQQEPASTPASQDAAKVAVDAPAAPENTPSETKAQVDPAPTENSAPAPTKTEKKQAPVQPKEAEPLSADADGEAETVVVKLTYQVREEDYPRVLAAAEKLKLTDEHIIKKAAQMVSPEQADFRSNSANRIGPSYRRAVKYPKAAVELWLDQHDPLRLSPFIGQTLRDVGGNAFDRAIEQLLNDLDSKKAKR